MSIRLVEKEDQELITKLEKYIQEQETGMDSFMSFIDLSYETDPNQINECLIDEEQDKIKNSCFFKGTKDNGLVELEIIDETQRNFLEKAVDYAFNGLSANTITIFQEGEDKMLESIGFESLGEVQGRFAYIKENVMEDTVGRIK